MNVTVIQPDTVHDTRNFAYSHAVRLGDLIFVAGQVPRDRNGDTVGPGDPKAQTEQVFANLKAVLEAAGSGLDRVGKVTVFITDLAHRPAIHEVRHRIFSEIGHYPASTMVVIKSLADPAWLIEIEAVALAG
jgi:2-iminobutanoate/2-iminopropanoate deaminase